MSQQAGQTLASHLIAQTISSVQLLESLGLIQHADAEVIRSKLPNPYATFPSLASASTGSEYCDCALHCAAAHALVDCACQRRIHAVGMKVAMWSIPKVAPIADIRHGPAEVHERPQRHRDGRQR